MEKSDTEVVLRCKNDVRNVTLGPLISQCFVWCHQLLLSSCVSQLLIYQQLELTVMGSDKDQNSIAALVQSVPLVDWNS